jgi:signal transduction histidine kinase
VALADAYTPELLPALVEVVERHALPLETAALFDELRIAAATEERSRLAREMHDGIAQDLAFLGYQLDALTAALRRTGSDEGVQQARQLRSQMTSLISDLRLSISDLRSSVGRGGGLGAALSEYARSAGTSSGIRVHLSLKEGSTRLPPTRGAAAADRPRGGRPGPSPARHEEPVRHARGRSALGEPAHRG